MENKFKISNKIKFCKLNKMWLLWFIQKFPCDRPSQRLRIG